MPAELVERASRGDQDAFAALAGASVDRCYALAFRILRDPDRAQDATQHALLGVWRDLVTLRDPAGSLIAGLGSPDIGARPSEGAAH
jgi:RNA polymerase sigma-70 factor, ECF subfamily